MLLTTIQLDPSHLRCKRAFLMPLLPHGTHARRPTLAREAAAANPNHFDKPHEDGNGNGLKKSFEL